MDNQHPARDQSGATPSASADDPKRSAQDPGESGPLPPYSYVSGRFPHPISHPDGHSHGVHPPPCRNIDDDHAIEQFERGVRLFNAGFYWESHEAWESVWAAEGPESAKRRTQALIKLAAAAVKGREMRPTGVQRHLVRAAELLREADGARDWNRVDWQRLQRLIEALSQAPDVLLTDSNAPVVVTVPFALPRTNDVKIDEKKDED